MPRLSAGLLMYRRRGDRLEVLLVHPGGPFWAKKDLGAWTIPKGELAEGEDELTTARREFQEETGIPPEGPFHPLGSVKQKAGKVVHAWAFEGDCDPAAIRSNTYRVQWPPGSGQWRTFPEVDRAEWFALEEAKRRINPAQAELIDTLAGLVRENPSSA
jgi:predicted NUDIX family NTP pyrophosphohydrolase